MTIQLENGTYNTFLKNPEQIQKRPLTDLDELDLYKEPYFGPDNDEQIDLEIKQLQNDLEPARIEMKKKYLEYLKEKQAFKDIESKLEILGKKKDRKIEEEQLAEEERQKLDQNNKSKPSNKEEEDEKETVQEEDNWEEDKKQDSGESGDQQFSAPKENGRKK